MLFRYQLGRPQRHPLPRPLPYTPAHLCGRIVVLLRNFADRVWV
jgi:hypothetical protein